LCLFILFFYKGGIFLNLSLIQPSKEILSRTPVLSVALKSLLSSSLAKSFQGSPHHDTKRPFIKPAKQHRSFRPDESHQTHHTTQNRSLRTFDSVPEAFSWANTHYQQWFKELTPKQRTALINYSWDQFKMVNKTLRSFGKNHYETRMMNPIINDLHSALKKASLPEDIIVYRRADKRMLGNYLYIPLHQLPGKKLLEKSFLSTSLIAEKTSPWEKKHKLLLKIHAPKGSNGAFIGFNSIFGDECEMLFDKNHSLMIHEAISNRKDISLNCTLISKSHQSTLS
jgi:hypothetical protein